MIFKSTAEIYVCIHIYKLQLICNGVKHGLSYMGKDRVSVCLRTHCCEEYL